MPSFKGSKIEQKQLNTWVSFQSAEQPLLGQFSVSGNIPQTILWRREICANKCSKSRVPRCQREWLVSAKVRGNAYYEGYLIRYYVERL
ncbi:hypothetical protein FQ192_33250 [Pseudomonas sp. ANT_J12]|nr:hypothetical protein FQ192_33250 [Pseudomonas sp. ANT_J12]